MPCRQESQHDADHGHPDEGGGASAVPLEVAQPPVVTGPAERSLEDPALRQHAEAVLIAATHDLDDPAPSMSSLMSRALKFFSAHAARTWRTAPALESAVFGRARGRVLDSVLSRRSHIPAARAVLQCHRAWLYCPQDVIGGASSLRPEEADHD